MKINPDAAKPKDARPRKATLSKREVEDIYEAPAALLRAHTRRDVLIFAAGTLAALAGGTFLLPDETLQRMGMPRRHNAAGKEWLLNKAIRFDDDVAEALYSKNRRVPTYSKSQITELKNNYNGATPTTDYIRQSGM